MAKSSSLTDAELGKLLEKLHSDRPMAASELNALIAENLGQEVAWTIQYRSKEWGFCIPRTLSANAERTHARVLKNDFIETAIEKTNLEEFRLASGRLNIRSLARVVQKTLMIRNQSLNSEYQRPISGIGLRTIENVIKNWLAEESENSSN